MKDPLKMLRQVQQMQDRMQKVQKELESETVEATAGGGAVTVVATGTQKLVSVRIDPEAAGDPPMLPEPLERLIQELSRLPGIGPKTAQRLAFHLLRVDRVRAAALAQAIEEVKARIGYCERCYNIAEGGLCAICASPRRDATVLCVVESAFDVLAIERTSEFSGLYVVLHGVISPIDGVGPEQIHVP